MNLYNCWHEGVPGQCYKLQHGRWRFVPDTGQVENRPFRDIQLSDLVFRKRSEYEHEMAEERLTAVRILRRFLQLPEFLSPQAVTVGGKLFMPGQR